MTTIAPAVLKSVSSSIAKIPFDPPLTGLRGMRGTTTGKTGLRAETPFENDCHTRVSRSIFQIDCHTQMFRNIFKLTVASGCSGVFSN